ncbi:sugar transferase [Alphaproteobacteria bacterium]|nr:sugar transferase [Alphaproteobacteria bacterium]
MKKCNVIRFFDFIFSLAALVTLAPLLIPVGIALKFTGEGIIFYSQERVGKNQETFRLLKFATMLQDSPQLLSGTITVKDDPRVLPFGRFLRETKINELPQLLNVLLGHMSLIGPRPLTRETFDYYPIDVQEVLTSVKPGLSGTGSIVFNDEESIIASHNAKDIHQTYRVNIAPAKGYLETWFVKNRSVSLYFKLVFLTLGVVVFKLKRPERFLMDQNGQLLLGKLLGKVDRAKL